jgi:hypothetical protein
MDFWTFLVDELWDWRAIRPKSKNDIFEKGIKNFIEMADCFQILKSYNPMGQPSIENLKWSDISSLFDVASSIKESKMPTFASKLCHFLFPSAYFVTDNTLVKRGWKSYWEYWSDLRAEWLKAPEKEALKEELRRNIAEILCASLRGPQNDRLEGYLPGL